MAVRIRDFIALAHLHTRLKICNLGLQILLLGSCQPASRQWAVEAHSRG